MSDEEKTALIAELQKKVARLEVRLDNQYDATQNLISRLSKVERQLPNQ